MRGSINNLFNLYAFFLLLSISGSYCRELDPEKVQLIDDVANGLFMKYQNVPGMSLSVTQDGETVFSEAWGKMDVENGIDATNETLFSIGSISKSFIATLVVKSLSEKFPTYGESILDAPIASLDPSPYPRFNFTFSDRFRAEQITFRDLLAHRTCLVSTDFDLIFGNMKTISEYSYRTRYQEQSCGHRNGFVYNNALFALAGELIASFEGKILEDMVRNFMLEIGMQNSTTIDASASYEDLPNMSQGYYRLNGQIQKYNMTLHRRNHIGLGAGGILSTSNDMAKYMAFQLNKGRVGNRQVVSAEAMSWLYKPSNVLSSIPGKDSGSEAMADSYAYGLGLMLGLYNGYAMITHGGYWPPYQSEMFLFPAKNIGVFLVTNGPGVIAAFPNHAYVNLAVFDIIRGVGKTSLTKNLKNPLPIRIPVFDFGNALEENRKLKNEPNLLETNQIERIEFEDAIGIYGDKSTGDLIITLDDQSSSFLQVNLGDWGIGRLHPVTGSVTKFMIEWKTDFNHHWYTYPPEIVPLPTFHVEFRVNAVYLLADDQVQVAFFKNATIGTFPVIPWEPNSCGPK